jgi:hypothetical protein
VALGRSSGTCCPLSVVDSIFVFANHRFNRFGRIERNDFLNPPFHASFTIFKSGKIQARCSRISADVTAMKAACKSVLSILEQHRSEIEAPANVATTKQHHNKTSPPRTSMQRGSPPGIRYPKGVNCHYL